MAPLNAVIDLSHFNTRVDFSSARADGILGVILKGTQGTDYIDPTYAGRQVLARHAGLLTGAYHFGTGTAGGADQANYFLQSIKPDPTTLVALDFEKNPQGPD